MAEGGMTAKGTLDESDKRRLVLRLVTQLHCVECGRLFDPHDFTLLHRSPELWVLGTRCQHCSQQIQVAVFMRLDVQPEPATDLMPEELQVADQWPVITADDVLDVHEALCECDDDLEAFFLD
jgi:hypothetical protein